MRTRLSQKWQSVES